MNKLEERLQPIFQASFPPVVSSASYAVMIDGEIVAKASFGRNEKHAGTYNIGSITKVYTTVAIMQLVERGLVELDKPVYEYLPRFKMADERYKKITLRHCLNHTSGMPGTQLRMLAAATPRRHYYEDVYRYMEHAVLHSEPGLFSVYCNDGFTLAEMVVAEVTGMEYSAYCRDYITEPIGAHSSRLPTQKNLDYPHTNMMDYPEEDLGAEGAGGIMTTMEDLCKFGQVFLADSSILSEKSKAEMNRPQGTTIIEGDVISTIYGLGWDSVDHTIGEYDLGDHVLMKGGGTIHFSSRLLVIPKYNAVLAISATVDCGAPVEDVALKLFAYTMLERGTNIWTNYEPIPSELKEKYEGLYVSAGTILDVKAEGPFVNIMMSPCEGPAFPVYMNLGWKDGSLEWKRGYTMYFTENAGKRYLMASAYGKGAPSAIKAEDVHFDPLPEKWTQIFGKRYIVADILWDDLVAIPAYNGIRFIENDRFPNAVIACVSGGSIPKPGPGKEYLMTPYVNGAATENILCGTLQLPNHAGRDQQTIWFYEKDGVSYIECSGYTYVDTESLEAYTGQDFAEREVVDGLNQVYAIKEKLENLPEVPEGRRIVVFNDGLSVIYDSMISKNYTPVESGFISLV